MTNEIIISNATDLIRVSASDVLAIKAAGNYCLLYLSDGNEHLVTYQLGQVEQMLSQQLGSAAATFIRIGRGLIINQEYLFVINLPRQQLIVRSFGKVQQEFSPPKEALRELKQYIEKRIKNEQTNE